MKKAQVTVFVVIAIIIAAAILSVFLLKKELWPSTSEKIPTKLSPFAKSYSSCLQSLSEEAIQILGQKGGYIYLPEKEQGSQYMPFGNSLNFLGNEIPYWFYISGNNLEKQQVPSLYSMEKDIEKYIEENINKCDFVVTEFLLQGFEIEKKGSVKARATIKDDNVAIKITRPFNLKLQNTRARIDIYNVEIAKDVGKVFKIAKKIMQAENEQLFLEKRTIDAIFLYDELPSTKTTLECYPKNWQIENVKSELKNILANNIPFTKVKGTHYLKANSYYEMEADVDNKDLEVNFMFIEKPFKLEINGQEQGPLKGEGISQLSPAFLKSFLCLSKYNFVYTIAYPVLVSIYDGKNNYRFQFPFVVFVNKNQARKAVETENFAEAKSEICSHKLAKETVFTFDSNARPLENVSISYKCINSVCNIGMTSMEGEQAILQANFPQCINGFIIAEKEGYARAKEEFSTNINDQTINLLLKPLTEIDIELRLIDSLGGERKLRTDESAIITFLNKKDELAETLVYPEETKVKLVDGDYNIRIQVFKEKHFSLEAQKVEKCFKVPGILGIGIFSKEKCETFEIPAIDLDQILFGGTQFDSLLEVQNKKKIILYAIEDPVPESVDEINAVVADISLNKDSPLFKEPEII